MIATLKGKLIRLDLNSLVLEVSGVGYEVLVPFTVHLAFRERLSEDIQLHIFHSITDRSQKLFGFLSEKDRELFKLVKSLQGIGELTALKILSFYGADDLHDIAMQDDRKRLEKIPKVKGKTSEKILFEVKQNLKKLESFLQKPKDQASEVTRESDLAILALIQLGYDEKTAEREVKLIRDQEPKLSAGETVRKVITK